MTEPTLTLSSLPSPMIEAIRLDAEHFPAYIQNRGKEYLVGGRVGPLEVEGHLVRATVRGTRTYRTAWRWNGQGAYPLCTCPVGPLCKHAYALARAIVLARDSGDRPEGVHESDERRGGSRDTRSIVEESQRPVHRADSDVEALRRAPSWDRNRQFARLVIGQSASGVYLTAYDFRGILEDPDPDLMCWRLAQEIPRHANGWLPRGLVMYRDRPDLAARAEERSQAEMTEGLTRWARTHAAPTSRSLRVVFGLEPGEDGEPVVTMQARATTPRLRDEPRSAQQLIQLGSELRRDVTLLAPPHARLLRVLVGGFLQSARFLDSRSFELGAGALNRLLDSLSDSPLATWGDAIDPVLSARAGILPGGRIRLEDGSLDVLPLCVNDGGGMRVALAALWPDGKHRLLDTLVYSAADDDLHPSLVLADGGFWRVGEEPPRDLLRRFATNGSLPVPETGRERFLELLASSFASVAEALAPHTRLHVARPAVAFDLRENDWLQVRLFAHTGASDWRPGEPSDGVSVFEYGPEGRWTQLSSPTTEARAAEGGLEGLGSASAASAPAAVADPHRIAQDPPGESSAVSGIESVGTVTAPAEPTVPVPNPAPVAPGPVEIPSGDVWLEAPDPILVDPAREWVISLPVTRGETRTAGTAALEAEDASIGWWLRLNSRNLESFAEAWEQRPTGVAWLGNQRMRELLGGSRSIRPRVRVTASGVDWFAVSAEWEAEGLSITDADLAKLRGARTRFVKLSSGWVRRELAEDFDRAAALLADLGVEAGAGEQRITTWQLAQARPEHLTALMDLGADPCASRDIERLRREVREFRGLPKVDVPKAVLADLRPYQREGLDFLAYVLGLGMGAILADDMGLGKTVQALAWLEHLRERDGDVGPALVVCPASVVHNWIREAERFTPRMRVLALTSGEERHVLRREIPNHDLVITNYALLRRDLEQWKAVPLAAAILDEAQNIKNPDAAVSRAVLQLDTRHRLALTGTPLENRALDLWSLMQFVNPGYLGSRSAFVARYDRPDAPPHLRRLLAARLRPVMLRRLKSQVALDLPERIEERRDCEMTRGQRQLYLAELARSRDLVERIGTSTDGVRRNKFEILAALTRLRQVCCHPALAGGKESLGSGKFDALFELLEPLLAEGHKVLVFSQFVECLKLLAQEMTRRHVRHHMLTGATTRREEVVGAFEGDPEPCVFLISLKAGGTGLNLTAASYVVLFDPWWNPAVEAQAIDRTHRIGQTRTVIAYRMLAEGTIEEKIWELQQRKAALVRDVLGEDGFARTLSRSDLDYLLGEGPAG